MAVASKTKEKYFLVTLGIIALIWLRSGIEKAGGSSFVASLPTALTYFASKNPYPGVKGFLLAMARPNYQLFGTLTILGELFAGAAILATILLLFSQKRKLALALLGAGLVVGAFLNLVFFLAAGWTSASTESLNILMLAVEVIGLGLVVGFPREG